MSVYFDKCIDFASNLIYRSYSLNLFKVNDLQDNFKLAKFYPEQVIHLQAEDFHLWQATEASEDWMNPESYYVDRMCSAQLNNLDAVEACLNDIKEQLGQSKQFGGISQKLYQLYPVESRFVTRVVNRKLKEEKTQSDEAENALLVKVLASLSEALSQDRKDRVHNSALKLNMFTYCQPIQSSLAHNAAKKIAIQTGVTALVILAFHKL